MQGETNDGRSGIVQNPYTGDARRLTHRGRIVDHRLFFHDTFRMKIVGKRRTSDDLTAIAPEEALRRATILQAQVDLLNPYPRPRGFVFKAKTWEEYESWRKAQSNPRLW